MGAAERVRDVVEPPLSAAGFELVDVELAGSTLRVSVDRPGGVDLDAVTAATHLVSGALDAPEGGGDPLPGRYVLEVSSPGVERPLRTPAQFQRFVGSTVAVKLRPDAAAAGVGADRRIEGVLDGANEAGVVVAGRRLSYDDIERARTVLVWGPASPGGSGSPSGSGSPRRSRSRSRKAHAR